MLSLSLQSKRIERERKRERMERGRQSGSSLTSDLFGTKDSSTSSSGIFGSIFSPPSKESLQTRKKNDPAPGLPAWTAKIDVSDKNLNSYYQQEHGVMPFHYSSSIYYGGQDVYSRPQEAPSPVFATFNKDGGEDNSVEASRGNWWQGSLYY